MKTKMKLISIQSVFQIRTLAIGVLFLSATSYAIPEKDTGNLGEIRHSILDEANFQELYGQGWVTMDGRDVQGSDLYKENHWKESTIPDARGVFLRSSNCGRSKATGNPSREELEVGSYQVDQLQDHQHGSNDASGKDGHAHQGHGALPLWYASTTQSLTSSPLAPARSGSETRPRCIVVNTFIKINRTPESQQTDVILNALDGIPTQIAKNENLKKAITAIVQQEVQKAIAQSTQKN